MRQQAWLCWSTHTLSFRDRDRPIKLGPRARSLGKQQRQRTHRTCHEVGGVRAFGGARCARNARLLRAAPGGELSSHGPCARARGPARSAAFKETPCSPACQPVQAAPLFCSAIILRSLGSFHICELKGARLVSLLPLLCALAAPAAAAFAAAVPRWPSAARCGSGQGYFESIATVAVPPM